MKKIILILTVFFVIFIGIDFYNSQKTVECWWGVMYPTLSFVAFESDDENEQQQASISTFNRGYYYEEEEPIKIKWAIAKWFDKYFGKE